MQVQKLDLQFACGKKGNVARVCHSRSSVRTTSKQKKQEVHRLAENESSPEQVHTLFYVKDRPHPPLTLSVPLNEAKLRMEVDTGAAVSLISDATFKSLWPEASRPPLQPSRATNTGGPSFRQRVVRMPQITLADSAWKRPFTPWQRLGLGPGAEAGRVISATHQERGQLTSHPGEAR